MDKKDLCLNPEKIDIITPYGKGLEPKIDPITPCGKGLEPKIDPITPYGKGLELKIDPITPYGKGLEPKIDPITDFGKGSCYMTCDGKTVATMEDVMTYNEIYYNKMLIKSEEEKGMRR